MKLKFPNLKLRLGQSAFLRIVVLLTVPCIVFTALIVAVSRNYLYDFFEDVQRESLRKTTDQISLSLEGSIQQTENMLLDLEPYCLNGGKNRSYPELEEELAIIYKYRRNYLDGVVFLGKDGAVVGVPKTYWFFGGTEKKLAAEMVRKTPREISWSPHFYSTITGSGANSSRYAPLALATLPVYRDGEYEGALTAVVSISDLLASVSVYGNDYSMSTYIYESGGQLADNMMFHQGNTYLLTPIPESSPEFQDLSAAREYLAEKNGFSSFARIEINPYWTVLAVGDIDVLERQFQPFNRQFSVIIIASFACLLTIYIFVVQWWFTRPLHQLSTAIQKVGGGDFDYRIGIDRRDEFGRVAGEFNHMSQLVKDLIVRLRAADLHVRQSDMAFLLSQINPHFLYNTLDAIDIMVDVSSKEEVHMALGELVSLLRYGLRKNQVSRLDEELEYIRNYIGLLKLRYGSGLFDYRIEMGEGTGPVRILKLLIQPIVENAVFHGFHPLKGRKGFLLIRSSLDGGTLQVEIADNGVGIPAEKLRAILRGKTDGRKTDGIGIANVDERIRLYYGENYGMKLTSKEGEGTRAVIRIPASGRGIPPADGESPVPRGAGRLP